MLDCRLVGEWWIRIVGGVWWFRRILVDGAVDLEKLFGLAKERLQIVVAEGPGWGHAIVVGHLFEVAAAEPWQAGAVHLGVPAHPVVDARLEELSGVGVIPGLRGDIALL